MRVVLIGHRGTGKSALLKRIEFYGLNLGSTIDLDQYIAQKEGDLTSLFASKGENFFRDLEKKYFNFLLQNEKNFILAVGAGFDLSLIPSDTKVIWVRRDTDSLGRIFMNRPRLNPDVDALTEFSERFLLRESQYKNRADLIYTVPEGLFEPMPEEQKILNQLIKNEDFPIDHAFETLNADFFLPALFPFEFRSDLLDQAKPYENFEKEKLYSQRSKPIKNFFDPKKWNLVDWDLSLGQCPWNFENLVLSSHAEKIQDGIFELEEAHTKLTQASLKLCPIIENFKDLELGYAWWSQNPGKRNFLPRSQQGRWAWFRLFMKGRQSLNFFRQGYGSSGDQPTLFQWLATPDRCSSFAAVLGDPVQSSHSPLFHKNFFSNYQNPYFAIKISEDEWDEAMPFLQRIGLRWASVTSPLKKKAFSLCHSVTESAQELQSVNTLALQNGRWHGENTDYLGLLKTFGAEKKDSIAVWGSGGLTSSLKKIFPLARFYSARQGCTVSEPPPEILIWASLRSPETQLPPTPWKPKEVWDMNYAENSMGLEYAGQSGVKYLSGLDFFKQQALEQQKFWSRWI